MRTILVIIVLGLIGFAFQATYKKQKCEKIGYVVNGEIDWGYMCEYDPYTIRRLDWHTSKVDDLSHYGK